MAFRVWQDLKGITHAIECKNTVTCSIRSGCQISGVFTGVITHDVDAIYLRTTGPSALAFGNKELPGPAVAIITPKVLGTDWQLKSTDQSPKALTNEGLASFGIATPKDSTVAFASGLSSPEPCRKRSTARWQTVPLITFTIAGKISAIVSCSATGVGRQLRRIAVGARMHPGLQ